LKTLVYELTPRFSQKMSVGSGALSKSHPSIFFELQHKVLASLETQLLWLLRTLS